MTTYLELIKANYKFLSKHFSNNKKRMSRRKRKKIIERMLKSIGG